MDINKTAIYGNKYKILNKIGNGAFGQVFLVVNIDCNKK